ncbi:hypothetical protein [Cupriavidus sp. Agwp_2]|uniref:hypothetical protein n=1 Tax=Cupriavidus sp. Agwp_2 TaxID=2897324 RepID=UPI0034613601
MNIAGIETSLDGRPGGEAFRSGDPFAFDLMVAYDAPKATITKLKLSRSDEELNRGEVHWKRKR